jgi:hypothetical protein
VYGTLTFNAAGNALDATTVQVDGSAPTMDADYVPSLRASAAEL